MAKKGGLGKGLDALFIDNTMEVEQMDKTGVMLVKITKVEPNKNQPRKYLDEDKIKQLSDSILEHGIIQPLIVREIGDERYQIVAGERRWRASKMAGLVEVPVIIKGYSDKETAEIALVENLQREDLNPIEEAEGYKSLMQEYAMTQEEVSKRVGKSRPAVANALRLMQLPDDVADLIKFGQISAGHGRALIPLGIGAMEAAGKVIKNTLSVRETEKLVKKMQQPAKEEKKEEEKNVYYHEVENVLTQHFGRKVRIHGGEKQGKIEIEFYSSDDFNSLIENLTKMV